MSEIEAQISDAMQKVRASLGLPSDGSGAGRGGADGGAPRDYARREYAPLRRDNSDVLPGAARGGAVLVGRAPVETVPVDVSDLGAVERAFIARFGSGAVCVKRFPEPLDRHLSRRVYLVFSVWELWGVRHACATIDGALVTETGKVNALAKLVI